MSRTLVVGDPIISLGERLLVPDGALIVEDNSIVDLGPRSKIEEQGPFDEVLGSTEHLIMPGFINCHYHSELAMGPGLYQFIFERANVHIQTAYGDISEEDLYHGILWGLIQAVKGRQTGTVDMYYGRPSLEDFGARVALQAYDDIGMRTAFGLVSRDENIYVHEPNEQFLARLPDELADEIQSSPMGYSWPIDEVMNSFERLVDQWHGRDGRIRINTAPDWTPACSNDLYVLCKRTADEHDTGMSTHVLETRSEFIYNLKAHGKPALRRLADIDVLGPNVVLEHFVWVTDEELKIFADSGAVASSNAGSNLRRAPNACALQGWERRTSQR